jgi:sugar diacid utilization regulator
MIIDNLFWQVNVIRITNEIAQQLVEFVSGETGFNMIVCDSSGVIIGDCSRERFGVKHDGAARIMRGEADSIAITREDAELSNGRMREGYNIVIKVDGERIGTFGIGGPLEIVQPIAKIASAVIAARIQETRHLELISEVAGEISRSVARTVAAIEHIYADAEELNAANLAVTQAVAATEEKIQDTNQMLDFILDVAEMTGLLGLNAAIIAAQAGQHGRGFGVVAEEIRKLGKNSSASVDKITAILGQIQSAVAEVSTNSQKTSGISGKQFHATQQIARDIADIKKAIDTLTGMVHGAS